WKRSSSPRKTGTARNSWRGWASARPRRLASETDGTNANGIERTSAQVRSVRCVRFKSGNVRGDTRSEPPGLLQRHEVFGGQLLALAELVEDLVRLGLRGGACRDLLLRGRLALAALPADGAQRVH